jgi:hypothetical protein
MAFFDSVCFSVLAADYEIVLNESIIEYAIKTGQLDFL